MDQYALGGVVGLTKPSPPLSTSVMTGWKQDEEIYYCMSFWSEFVMYELYYSSKDSHSAIRMMLDEQDLPSDILVFFKSKFDVPNNPEALSHKLPGVDKIVKHPVTHSDNTLHAIIMDLNDRNQKDKGRPWTREEIADWIEAAMPLEDITFKPVEVNNEVEGLSEFTKLVKTESVLPRQTLGEF